MMRMERPLPDAAWVARAPQVRHVHPQCDHQGDEGRQTALKTARRAHADEGPHDEAQVESPGVDEQPFQDVRVASQVRSTEAASFVEMRIRSFQQLAAFPQQGQSTGAADAPAALFFQLRGPRSGSAM